MATPHSASLWVWMPTSARSPSSPTTAAVAAATWLGQARAVGVAERDVLRARRRPPRSGTRARSRSPRARRRRSARRRRRPACRCARQKLTESMIIARFSSRDTLVTFSRWSAQVLPTRQTTGAKEADERAQAGVLLGGDPASAGHPERARSRSCSKRSPREQLEELRLLRVRAGEAGLDEVDAEPVEGVDDAHLLGGGERHALPLHAVAEGGVVELVPGSRWFLSSSRERSLCAGDARAAACR